MNDFLDGIKKSIPIFLGYFAVSFTFGIYCNNMGITPIVSFVMSLTELSSAGEFGGVELINKNALYAEIAAVVLIINLRYVLMSISLATHLDKDTKLYQKLVFGFGITDEIYALAIKEKKAITAKFMFGMMILPIVGWSVGTLLGTLSSKIIPTSVSTCFNLALYVMFICVIFPDAKESYKVLICIGVSALISCILYYIPFLNEHIRLGFKLIIATISACTLMAVLFPQEKKEEA
ncbi:MAG: AzlC family ABC transporter permease [Bacilli bacterium]|nr:AzlC family ABC transporter permease [Bacilli bacterium]